MICFPNAKINLGLHIIRKREDDYHEIESLLYPIPFRDVLEIRPAENLTFTTSGLSIPGDIDKNLCLKAFNQIKKDFHIPAIEIHLHKVIPMGGGLGGGSSNGAFMLKLLNDTFELGLSDTTLESYATNLGSDCPFFIKNKPALATGRGTDLSPVELSLSGMKLLLVFTDVHSSTAEAYGGVIPSKRNFSIIDLMSSDLQNWKEKLANDFEASIFKLYPSLEDIKKSMYDSGAIYSSMTGSGSVMYGIFTDKNDNFRSYNHLWLEL